MTSVFPKQPGYYVYHDPTKTDFKKVSSIILNKINNNEYKLKKDFTLPRLQPKEDIKVRDGSSLSYSQSTYINHFQEPIKELFQPDWVKLDKQVLRFNGYYKESVDESRIEHARVRRLVILYYLVDDTVEINECKEMNSGLPQGLFLVRSKLEKKSDSNQKEYYNVTDFEVGKSIDIYGKSVTLFDCDQYTREFYRNHGVTQGNPLTVPEDSFHIMKQQSKIVHKKDNLMKDYLEHRQGGGKVKNQKQFLENDRRVLKFNASHDSLKYVINYYLADDTVEIKELFFNNSGRIKFPLFLNRNKLPKKFSINQPGELNESDFITPVDIEVSSILF